MKKAASDATFTDMLMCMHMPPCRMSPAPQLVERREVAVVVRLHCVLVLATGTHTIRTRNSC